MRSSLQQIETFYWAARLGSFHAAARRQHLTQPTISARIQELEAHLGVRLFERGHGRSSLTLAGQAALVQAERILKLADEFERLAERSDPMHGLLRFGANESTALAGLADLLTQLKNTYAGLQIEITVDVGVALSRKLERRELDIAILNDEVAAPHIIEETIGRTDLHWVASPRLVRKREVTPADLIGLPIITVSYPSSNHALVTNWYHSAGLEPANLSSSNSLSMMVRLVAAGHGIAVLSPAIMRAEIDAGLIHVLTSRPRLKQQRYLIAYQAERRGSGIDTIVRLTKEMLASSGVLKLR
jgi:DNA-binding transcriptional LysR family regulator